MKPIMQVRANLMKWFMEPPGQYLWQAEQSQVGSILADLFGYYLIQVGRLGEGDLLSESRIPQRIILDLDNTGNCKAANHPMCRAVELPLPADSIDVVVLPHVLEFEAEPVLVLEEVARVLMAEGHVVIVGFNPWSLWGIMHIGLVWGRQVPWCGRFISPAQVRDWLHCLDFEIVSTRSFHFSPPLKNPILQQRLNLADKLTINGWPRLGGVYVIVAKKRVIALTPIMPAWRKASISIPAGEIAIPE